MPACKRCPSGNHLLEPLLVFKEVALDALARIEQISLPVKEQEHRGCCCSIVNVHHLQYIQERRGDGRVSSTAAGNTPLGDNSSNSTHSEVAGVVHRAFLLPWAFFLGRHGAMSSDYCSRTIHPPTRPPSSKFQHTAELGLMVFCQYLLPNIGMNGSSKWLCPSPMRILSKQ